MRWNSTCVVPALLFGPEQSSVDTAGRPCPCPWLASPSQPSQPSSLWLSSGSPLALSVRRLSLAGSRERACPAPLGPKGKGRRESGKKLAAKRTAQAASAARLFRGLSSASPPPPASCCCFGLSTSPSPSPSALLLAPLPPSVSLSRALLALLLLSAW